MKKAILIKKLKLICCGMLVLSSTACIHDRSIPSDSVPLTKWTTPQLVNKGKQEFTDKNYPQSIRYLHEAAKRDNREALYALGFIQYHGLSVPKNPKLAQDLIRRSAELGYEPAIKALRLFITTRSQFTVTSKNPAYLSDNGSHKAKNPSISKEEKFSKKSTQNQKTKLTKATTANKKQSSQKTESVNNIKTASKKSESSVKDTKEAKNSNKVKIAANNKIITPGTNVQIINSSKSKAEVKTESKTENKQIVNTKDSIKIITNINKDWLDKQNPDYYTIQVMADDNLNNIEKFISDHHLENKLQTFSYYYKDKLWYGAGYGVYPKSQEAYSALLKDMPDAVSSKKPWVRQFKNIHKQQKEIS